MTSRIPIDAGSEGVNRDNNRFVAGLAGPLCSPQVLRLYYLEVWLE